MADGDDVRRALRKDSEPGKSSSTVGVDTLEKEIAKGRQTAEELYRSLL